MKKIALLGATGSIGSNTLKVVEANPEKFKIVSLAAGTNTELLIRQIQQFSPEFVTIPSEDQCARLKSQFPAIRFGSGEEGLIDAVSVSGVNTVVSAIGGTVPLSATLEAIRLGHRICLANKETLVAAGKLINTALKKHGSELIPIDSEQSAIFQSLQGNQSKWIKKVILTASGGPFYNKPELDFNSISVADALAHPTWNMGTKITIDSATLMNKALEVIEAYYLFPLKSEQIDVVIHPQSIVHSLIEYVDASFIAQLSDPDMKIPIQYALSWPERIYNDNNKLQFDRLSKLEFYPVDREKFVSIQMAFDVIRYGKNSGAVFNASNEVAVDYFLKEKIRFNDIFNVVESILYNTRFYPLGTLSDVESTIDDTKTRTDNLIREKYIK